MEPAKKADKSRPFLSKFLAGSLGSDCCFSLLLCDLTLQQASALRKFLVVRLDEERIETAAMFNRTQSVGGNAQAIALAERFGHQRNIAEVRQKAATRLVVRVADIVAVLDRLAGQFTSAGHFGLTFNYVLQAPTRMSEFKQSTQFDAAGARSRTGGLLGKSRFYSDSSRCSQVRFRIHRAKTRFSGFRTVFTKACDHNFASFAWLTQILYRRIPRNFWAFQCG